MTEGRDLQLICEGAMDFTCVGFDLRQWPWTGPFNADETGWERHDVRYQELVKALGLWQNEYQLLEVALDKLTAAVSLVGSWADCNLVAIEYPTEIVSLRDSRLGFHTAATSCDLGGFICRGLDVCDVNGLFSVLHHPDIQAKRGSTRLFDTQEMLQSLEVVQYANVLDPSHAPFSVAKIWSLK